MLVTFVYPDIPREFCPPMIFEASNYL
ncbi:hypothetical protein Tco_0812368, partial [Tanacetum coccineum]